MIADEIKKSGINSKLIVPQTKYCMDNAAMVALAANFLGRLDRRGWYNVEVKTNSWQLKHETRNT